MYVASIAMLKRTINGERGITADTALRLARWMGTSPHYWLNLQAMYELRKAEQEHGETIREKITPLEHVAA